MAPGLGLLLWDEENQSLWHQLDLFISGLTDHMNLLDSRLGLQHQYTGSIAEGTKVGLLDEVDFQLHVTALTGLLHVQQQPNNGPIDIMIHESPTRHKWKPFLTNDNVIRRSELYSHMHKLLCQVLSDKDSYGNTNFYFFHINILTLDIFLEWAPTGHIIKLDPAFVVCLTDWTPPNYRQTSKLLQGFDANMGCHSLLRPWGWKPTIYAQEQHILRNMPLAPRLAYISLKICNDLIYDNAIKTYDIKNSLLQCLHENHEEVHLGLDMLPCCNDISMTQKHPASLTTSYPQMCLFTPSCGLIK